MGRNIRLRFAIVALATGATFATCAAIATFAAADAPVAPSARIAWLAGCWLRETPQRIVEEQWMAPRAGAMLGMGRTVALPQGAVVDFEAMRIEERGYSLVFTAKPSGQEAASFPSTAITDSMVVFENPEHDYPTKVCYERTADGGMTAWIEGPTKSGKPKRFTFEYKRAPCPGGEGPR